mmetsp:Transcript_19675/g.39701  ORF Transcript_19675/g.39701 Transcript_19675/m.39701 type:complete len:411 (-) Transcript_19675:101-1333(-)
MMHVWRSGSYGWLTGKRSVKPFMAVRSYISLKDIFFGDSESEIELSRAGTNSHPVAKKVNGRYISPWSAQTEKRAFDTLRYFISSRQNRLKLKKKQVEDTSKLLTTLRVDRAKCKSTKKPHVTWIGHATCYYQTEGVFFLTDPLWSERTSPSQMFGPKRYVDPPIEIEDLKVDVVLLSHTHYDHLDYGSAQRIGNKALWVVPLGVKAILKDMGVTNCVELDWWQSHTHFSPSTGANIEIIFTPAKHWTARGLLDRNTCLWGSFAVRSPQSRFFFTGDTAYCPVFKQIGDSFGPFDFAAIPIGAYAPRWFMKDVHCNPEEAVRIHQDLRARRSVGIHWGTFPMADEDFIEPALELARSRDVLNVSASDFFTMKHGETLYLDESSNHDFATHNTDLYGDYLDALRSGESGKT